MDARPARRSIAVAGLALCLLSSGCAARRDRFAPQAMNAPQARVAAPRSSLAAPEGYASFGSRVRLRDDTPALTPILEADHAAARRLAQEGTWVEVASYGAAGPSGNVGYVAFTPPTCVGSPGYGAPGWGCAGGTFAGPYAAPVGSIPSGIRDPSGSPAFAASTYTRNNADGETDRPGLSTGSGIYARNAGR